MAGQLKQLNVKVSPDSFGHSHQFGKIQKPVLNSLFGYFHEVDPCATLLPSFDQTLHQLARSGKATITLILYVLVQSFAQSSSTLCISEKIENILTSN